MKKLCAVLVASCAFNAMADSISLRNQDPEPIYLAVNKSVPVEESGWAAHSGIGWIHQGQVGLTNAADPFLTNMGIHQGDQYAVGYFDSSSQEYGLCGIVMSGSNRAFQYKDGQCTEILAQDEILMTNADQNPAYIYLRGGDVYPDQDVIKNDAGWVTSGQTYGFASDDLWLQHMGIAFGDTYAIGFQDSHNNKFLCADNVISGSQRHFKLTEGECVEVK